MKKIQIVFAALALFFAGIGVFAKKMPTTTYYLELNAGDKTCATIMETSPCEQGSSTQCSVIVAPGQTRYVTFKVDSNPCEILKRL